MQVTFTFDATDPAAKALFAKLMASDPPPVPELEAPPAQPEAPPPAPAETPPEPTPAQQRAAHARAARAAAAAAKANKPADVEDLNGPAEPNGAAESEDDFGLTPPNNSMSPGEAHEAALALVREIYAAGKVGEVKALQKEWGVAKFYDIPLEKSYDFYANAMKIAQTAGLRK